MKYQFIKKCIGEFSVTELCNALSVSMSGYYFWLTNPSSARAERDKELSKKITMIHHNSRQCYGSPRIYESLKKAHEKISRKRVIRLMQANNLSGKVKRRFKTTTNSNHALSISPNRLKQQFNVKLPNNVWVGDITYIPTGEGWLYLAVVIDLFSRQVVGWAMDKQMTRQLVGNALAMGCKNRNPKPGIMFHSDRGSQYASTEFRRLLTNHGFIASMSGKGNCFDNAVAESFFHSLKVEWIYPTRFTNREQAKQSIFEYIEVFYNRNRLHSTLNYCTPVEFEQKYWANNVA